MLELKWTGHLNHFKQLIGQTNHYLITILIGLEGVRTGKVTKGETFNVTWNPQSIEESAKRSRRFARNSALSWTIDALDSYLGFLKKSPFKFPEPFQREFQNDRSVYKNFKRITELINYPVDLPLAIVHLGIQWRNNLVHYHAENVLEQEYTTYIRNIDNKDIQERFRGLDAKLMLENFNAGKNPTFKEVAAIIQSTHYLVLEFDKQLREYVDIDIMVSKILEKEKELNKIIKAPVEKRTRKMRRYLISKGFEEVESTNSKASLDDSKIEELIKTCAQQNL
jgi:hypothetical protein